MKPSKSNNFSRSFEVQFKVNRQTRTRRWLVQASTQAIAEAAATKALKRIDKAAKITSVNEVVRAE